MFDIAFGRDARTSPEAIHSFISLNLGLFFDAL
jgi:hypothetical protein